MISTSRSSTSRSSTYLPTPTFPEVTQVSGRVIHAHNGSFYDDGEKLLLARTVARILHLGYEVQGIYFDDEGGKLNPEGWLWIGNYDRVLSRRTYLVDVGQDGEKIGTVKVIEVIQHERTVLRGRDENGREVWQSKQRRLARVSADAGVLALLRA